MQGEIRQSLHWPVSKVGSTCLHSLHIKRFFRANLHMAQISSARAVLSKSPLASEAAVFTIRVLTSCSFSIERTLPLT